MAKSTELQYYPDATATCSNCTSVYTFGMTVEKITVEICGNCHPFYTGQETLIDTAGRIEKFQARASQVADVNKKSKFKVRKSRQSLADLVDEQEVVAKPVKVAKPKKAIVEEKSAEVEVSKTPEVTDAPESAESKEVVS